MEIKQEIELFEAKIKNMVEYDYGDFMRKTNTYLNRLLENFTSLTPESREIFKQLKMDIQFSSGRDIDMVSERILKKTQQLKSILKS